MKKNKSIEDKLIKVLSGIEKKLDNISMSVGNEDFSEMARELRYINETLTSIDGNLTEINNSMPIPFEFPKPNEKKKK